MSSRSTSRVEEDVFPRLIVPSEFTPLMCDPATPTNAEPIDVPAAASADSMAFLIASAVRSRLTMRPFRQPFDSATPSPATCSFPCEFGLQTSAQVLTFPRSSPTMYWSLLANLQLILSLRPISSGRIRSLRRCLGIDNHLISIAQVNRVKFIIRRLNLRKTQEISKSRKEMRVSEMNLQSSLSLDQ